MPAGAGGPPAPATVHGVPGVPGVACCAWCAWRPWCAWRAWCACLVACAWCAWRAWRAWSYALSGDFLSSGCRRRSASGGFDWRDVAQVEVPFACGLFSSVGRFYRSSSVRGSGPGVSSTHFWSLLHWRRLSVVFPAALVDCCLASLRAGVGSPLAVADFRAGIDGCLFSSPSGEEVGSFSYTLAFSRLDFGFV